MVRTHYALGALLLSAACGGSEAGTSGLSSTVRFAVFKGGENVPCSAVSEISRIDGRVTNSNGTLAYRADANCQSGVFEMPGVANGEFTLELTAKGSVGGDAEATLFTARTDLSLPADDNLEVSLRPEVAYLNLEWNFGGDALAPCAQQIERVTVTIGTGNTQTGNFFDEYDCRDTPISIPTPFGLAEHIIKVEAYNASGFIDFTSEARRVFDRGDNSYSATLAPIGGTVLLDWTFAAGAEMSQSCDAPFVDVDQVRATVRANDGGASTSEVLACSAARPYVYRARRFAPGRDLELVLEADGADTRFRAVLPFRMPNGDFAPTGLVMDAVGTATVGIEVQTSTCTSAETDHFEVRVFEQPTRAGEALVFETSTGPDELSVALPWLKYGSYRVEVVQQGPQNPICALDELRLIDGRENAWDPFLF